MQAVDSIAAPWAREPYASAMGATSENVLTAYKSPTHLPTQIHLKPT